MKGKKKKTNEQKKKIANTEQNRTVLHGAGAFTKHKAHSTEYSVQCNKPCEAKLSKQYTTISDYYNL